MIQFAPMARNEPLAGGTAGLTGNTGGSLPGSSGNGQDFGYSIGGGADSENSYLVEGQDTENISGGFSGANVPFQFIQEVQVKTSGIEAEHGGALGGVVNVVMQKGSNAYHGRFSPPMKAPRRMARRSPSCGMTRVLSVPQTALPLAMVVPAVDLMPRLKNIRGRKITSVILTLV